jgi:hypothetical protein
MTAKAQAEAEGEAQAKEDRQGGHVELCHAHRIAQSAVARQPGRQRESCPAQLCGLWRVRHARLRAGVMARQAARSAAVTGGSGPGSRPA